jgi:hypothetical protein
MIAQRQNDDPSHCISNCLSSNNTKLQFIHSTKGTPKTPRNYFSHLHSALGESYLFPHNIHTLGLLVQTLCVGAMFKFKLISLEGPTSAISRATSDATAPKTAASETAQFVRVPPTNAAAQSTHDDGKSRVSSSAYEVNMTMRVIKKIRMGMENENEGNVPAPGRSPRRPRFVVL